MGDFFACRCDADELPRIPIYQNKYWIIYGSDEIPKLKIKRARKSDTMGVDRRPDDRHKGGPDSERTPIRGDARSRKGTLHKLRDAESSFL
ncbi:hypothetical protein Zmor_009629 [Zophobas morio]|uniref:Uncharacterized protein n=1 Tax=Zophobas morio TaxID=2755281 RepID=A0AA38IPH8_9CUCU|nr:hypothetical protein Zmor_009629 [Zophobas morio]